MRHKKSLTPLEVRLEGISKVRRPIAHLPQLLVRVLVLLAPLQGLLLRRVALLVDARIQQDDSRNGNEPNANEHQLHPVWKEKGYQQATSIRQGIALTPNDETRGILFTVDVGCDRAGEVAYSYMKSHSNPALVLSCEVVT